MPSSHSINRLFVFVGYAKKLSPTIKSFMFASAFRLPRFFIQDFDRTRPEDYLNVNVDSISDIPRSVLSL